MSSIIAGIGWHMVGAASAASFYAPIGKVKKWSWETTWTISGIVSWILLPIGVSVLLLPDFWPFYAQLDPGVVLRTVLFGCVWGIGSVNYGLAMRYLGLSLGIGVSIGVALVVGTLAPPILHGHFLEIFATGHGLITLAGIVVALLGVAIVSYAGHQKEQQLGTSAQQFNLKIGLLVACLAGAISSGMSFAIDAAKPIESAALHLGVNPLYAALPSYVLIMGGGAFVNFSYCIFRLIFVKELSLTSDLTQPWGRLGRNLGMAAMGGTMWYLQFFFYAWGASNIPSNVSYVSWMLHMSFYVLFGGLVGVALGEWRNVKARSMRMLWLGIIVIIVAANLVGIGIAY